LANGSNCQSTSGLTTAVQNGTDAELRKLQLQTSGTTQTPLKIIRNVGQSGKLFDIVNQSNTSLLFFDTNNNFYVGLNTRLPSGVTDAISLGKGSSASFDAVALGTSANASSIQTVAIGASSRAFNSSSIAIGVQSEALSNRGIAIGNLARVTADGERATGLGYANYVSGYYALGLGNNVFARFANSTAIGGFVDSNAKNAMVMGYGNDVSNRLINPYANSFMLGFNKVPYLFINGSGYTGINTVTPRMQLEVNGSVYITGLLSAQDIIDRTEGFNGTPEEALAAIIAIGYQLDANNNTEIDHDTLIEFLRAYYDEVVQVCHTETVDGQDYQVCENNNTLTVGRSITNSITLLSDAVKALNNRSIVMNQTIPFKSVQNNTDVVLKSIDSTSFKTENATIQRLNVTGNTDFGGGYGSTGATIYSTGLLETDNDIRSVGAGRIITAGYGSSYVMLSEGSPGALKTYQGLNASSHLYGNVIRKHNDNTVTIGDADDTILLVGGLKVPQNATIQRLNVTGNTNLMGNVGIGNNNPSGILVVNGTNVQFGGSTTIPTYASFYIKGGNYSYAGQAKPTVLIEGAGSYSGHPVLGLQGYPDGKGLKVNTLFFANGDLFIGINTSNVYGTPNAAQYHTYMGGDGSVIFNEQGDREDFRVESDANPNALFVQGTSNNVGINTASPRATLDTVGTIRTVGLTVDNNMTLTGNLTMLNGTLAVGANAEPTTLTMIYYNKSVNGHSQDYKAQKIVMLVNSSTTETGVRSHIGQLIEVREGTTKSLGIATSTQLAGQVITVDAGGLLGTGNPTFQNSYGLRVEIAGKQRNGTGTPQFNNYALFARANCTQWGTNNCYGLYSTGSGGDTNYAAYLDGATTITGDLAAYGNVILGNSYATDEFTYAGARKVYYIANCGGWSDCDSWEVQSGATSFSCDGFCDEKNYDLCNQADYLMDYITAPSCSTSNAYPKYCECAYA
jgi:hypothetical protein